MTSEAKNMDFEAQEQRFKTHISQPKLFSNQTHTSPPSELF